MTNFVTMGLGTVQAYQPGPNEACISIAFADGSCMAELSPDFAAVLRVNFDDCTLDRTGLPGSTVDITDEQARRIVQFARENAHRDTIVVHCFAGVSRSVSVAMALAGNTEATPPNRPVYEAVCSAMRGPLEDTTRSASRAERADEDTRITRKQIEELERCDPDFGVDGIDVVGGMSSRKNGSWLLRSDVLALFDVARSASRPEEPRNG